MFKLSKGRRQQPRIAIVRHSSYPEDIHIRRDAMALRNAGFDVELIRRAGSSVAFFRHLHVR